MNIALGILFISIGGFLWWMALRDPKSAYHEALAGVWDDTRNLVSGS